MADSNKQDKPYSITSIDEGFTQNDAKRLIPVKIVHFKTVFGDVGSVEVAKDTFSADLIDALIMQDVTEYMKLRGIA